MSKVVKSVTPFSIKRWIIALVARLMQKERSPKRLALSCCLGIYVAFSPFIGLHTVLVFLCSWLFALNFTVLFIVSTLINNPWTMVPVYMADYIVGDCLFHLFNINSMSLNPEWLAPINKLLQHYVGLAGVSLWSFLVGGNLLGAAVAVILYPILKRIFGLLHK